MYSSRPFFCGWDGCRSLFFIIWNILCQSHLVYSVSVEKSADSLSRAPLYVTRWFSLAAFNILSLSLNFSYLIVMCLVGSLRAYVDWDPLCFLGLQAFFLHQIKEFFCHFFQTSFLSLALFLLLLVYLWYKYCYVSCCPKAPYNYAHSFWVFLFCFVALTGCFFFHPVFQLTGSILCFN